MTVAEGSHPVRDISGTASRAGNTGAVDVRDGASRVDGAGAIPGAVTPRLRGLLHAWAFPVATAAAAALVMLAPTWPARLAAAVYGVAGMAMFGVSAAYHRSPPGSRRRGLLGRLDHVSILLMIAGTYTPLAILALHGWTRLGVLAVIWSGAAGGTLARLSWRPSWRPAPRWVSTALFIALGWVALLVLPQLLRGAGALVLVLIMAGGITYSLGALVYARKRPDPSPRWFGFHEVFHAATILAYLTQYAAVSLVVYRAA
jgi:hemolysin III